MNHCTRSTRVGVLNRSTCRAGAYTRPRIEPLERRALLSAAVLDAHNSLFRFVDAGGDSVGVRFTGPGSAAINLTNDATDHADIDSISLFDTDAASSLRIRVTRGNSIESDGATTLATLTGPALGRLRLNDVFLVGSSGAGGIDIAGSLGILDFIGNAGIAASSIHVAGDLGRLCLRDTTGAAGFIADSILDVAGSIGTIRANGLVNVDARVGGSLHSLTIRPNHAPASGSISSLRLNVAGTIDSLDLHADLSDDSIIAAAAGLIRVRIAGGMHDSMILAGASLDENLGLDNAFFGVAPIVDIRIKGDVVDSIIAASGDPGADRLFQNHDILDGGVIGTLRIDGYLASAHSPHPNPGVYAAQIDTIRVRGFRLEGKPDDLRAGLLGNAVIDPLPNVASALTEQDIEQVLVQMIARATQLGFNATLAVTDREGNILAAARMTDPALLVDPGTSTITGNGIGGLEGVTVASSITAVTKAGTASFLSSTGNAFSTRTAGQIIQRNFPPGTRFQDSGPLFGVQFSSLPTSDINRLPLGLSADPGGLPLYRNGQLLGGVGVELNGTYTVDASSVGGRATNEERIAAAGQTGFAVPGAIRASEIFVDGIRLDFANLAPPTLASLGVLPDFDTLVGAGLVDVLVAPRTSPATMFTPTTLGSIIGETLDGFASGRIEAFALGEADTVYAIRTADAFHRELISVNIPTGAVSLIEDISDGDANEIDPGDEISAMIFDDAGTPGVTGDDSLVLLNFTDNTAFTIDITSGAVSAPAVIAVPDAMLRDAVFFDNAGTPTMLGISRITGQVYRIDFSDVTSVANFTALTDIADGRAESFTLSTAAGSTDASVILADGRSSFLATFDAAGAGPAVTIIENISNGGPNEIGPGHAVSALAYDDRATVTTADDRLIAQNTNTGSQFFIEPVTGAIAAAPVHIADSAARLEQARLVTIAGITYAVGASTRNEQLFALDIAAAADFAGNIQLTFPDNSMLTRDGALNSGEQLTAADVELILTQAHEINRQLRAQIRRDHPQISQVNVAVVDINGDLLGVFRTPDAPVFGFDVSVQKARSSLLFSRDDAGALLSTAEGGAFASFVTDAADVGIDLDGSIALSDRAIGFLSRPFLPDGIPGTPPGPFSAQAPDVFSVFSTGLQTQLLLTNLVGFLGDFAAVGNEGLALQMFGDGLIGGGGVADPSLPLANGLQIFPGSVPLYKNGVLVGAVGVSGDGIEQDDYVSFSGATGFQDFGPGVRRSDDVIILGNIRLPYVKLPRSPFGGY